MPIELVEYKDCIQPFLIHHSNIRGKAVRLVNVTETILTRHEYPAVVSHLLAELLVIVAMLSANLKGKGILTVQLKGDGPVRFMVADSTASGKMRGYAEIAEGMREKLEAMKPGAVGIPDILGKGYICITLDQGKEPYQGIVELSGQTLSNTIEAYFTNSEQSEVTVRIAVGRGQREDWHAGGILLQRVPGEGGIELEKAHENQEETWQHTCLFMDTVKDVELLDQYLPINQLLYRLFNEDGVWVYDAVQVKAECRCSRKKISRMLASFPQEEIESLMIKGKVSVVCQFCSREQRFNPKQLAKLYSELPGA